jgi:hypothetical protein
MQVMAGRDAAIAAALDQLVAAASAVSEEPSRVASGTRVTRTGQTPKSQVTGCEAGTCGVGWWACQDLNLGPHPYQDCPGMRSCWPSGDGQLIGGARATVVVRSVPLLTVRCGTRVARPANDVGSAWQRWLQLERWARPGQATPASLSEYIASAYERPVRPDRSDESGPGTSSNRQRPRTGVDLTGGER